MKQMSSGIRCAIVFMAHCLLLAMRMQLRMCGTYSKTLGNVPFKELTRRQHVYAAGFSRWLSVVLQRITEPKSAAYLLGVASSAMVDGGGLLSGRYHVVVQEAQRRLLHLMSTPPILACSCASDPLRLDTSVNSQLRPAL